MANEENLKPPWKPGESGNLNGRPRTKPMTDMLKGMLDKDDAAEMKLLLDKAITAAKAGDFRFFQEIINRSDGKVIEQIDLTADVNVQEMPGLTELDLANLAKGHDGPE